MPTRATQQDFSGIDVDVFDEGFGDFRIGERAGPPPAHLRGAGGSSWRSASLTLVVLGLTGFLILKTPEAWRAMVINQARSLVSAAIEQFQRSDAAPVAQAAATASEPSPLPQQREIAAAAGADTGTLVAADPVPVAAQTDESAGVQSQQSEAGEAAAPEPLPPPSADPADPLQKRALAIGLHPDLSPAVLERLSEADWKNAAHAIHVALVAKSKPDVVAWPQTTQAKLARFEVRFVRAASSECRRYVVTVIKDRWSTTARAMELCGEALSKIRA